MDAATVADIVPYEYLAAPHAVSDCIPGASMDNKHAAVHCIPWGVFGVSVNYAGRPAHEHPEVSSGNSVDYDADIASYPVAYEALAEHIIEDDLFCPVCNCSPYFLV